MHPIIGGLRNFLADSFVLTDRHHREQQELKKQGNGVVVRRGGCRGWCDYWSIDRREELDGREELDRGEELDKSYKTFEFK